MKILLTAINSKYIHSNPAVYSLKAFSTGKTAAEIEIAEYTINQTLDDILMSLYKNAADVYVFSCYIWNISYVENVIRELKKVRPDSQIWVGGPEVSYDAEDVLTRNPGIDIVMKGEGEKTFAELAILFSSNDEYDYSCGKLFGREGLQFVKGISYRGNDPSGGVISNSWREPLNMDLIPFAYSDMADSENRIVYYESSRGCPFSCSYCLSSIDKALRFRDIKTVEKELQFFLDHKVPQVKFVDRTFNCKHENSLAVWKYISDHDNGITNFHFEVSADLLTEEELSVIKSMRPGLIQLEIGVQSTNPETVSEIHRTMNFNKVAENTLAIKSFGNTHQHLDLIAGLPYETLDIFKKSFNDLYELQPDQLQLGFLKVLKGSFMYDHAHDYGVVYKNQPPYEVLSTKWLSYQDVITLKGVEEMVEVYYNSNQFSHTLPFIIKMFPDAFAFFEALAEFYESEGLSVMSHNRAARYEILLSFAASYNKEETFLEMVVELLTFDYYLRENAKSRPAFAGEELLSKEAQRDFYSAITENVSDYLPEGYKGMDMRAIRRMTHLEKFRYDVAGDMTQTGPVILFDYQRRNPLDHRANIIEIDLKGELS